MILIAFAIVTAATPKPGPSVKLTLVNKMEDQDATVTLNGLTNFYQYYLIAKSYATLKETTGEGMQTYDGILKSNETVYEVRKDVYEATVIACGSVNSGIMELTRNTRVVFPLCSRDMYGKQTYISPRSVCLTNPANPVCKKQGFILTSKGNKGETGQIKIRRPPSEEAFFDE